MTKKWSSTASLDGQTKRQASKTARRSEKGDLASWLEEQGAVESVGYDSETGTRQRVFTIDLEEDALTIPAGLPAHRRA